MAGKRVRRVAVLACGVGLAALLTVTFLALDAWIGAAIDARYQQDGVADPAYACSMTLVGTYAIPMCRPTGPGR